MENKFSKFSTMAFAPFVILLVLFMGGGAAQALLQVK